MEHNNHTYLGTHETGYGPVPLWLSRNERMVHAALVGASGAGKSNLLRTIAAQDIARGDGLLFIDTHGEEAEALLDLVPAWRYNQVAYLHLADAEWPVALNVLECDHPDDHAQVADALVSALRDIWFDSMTAAPRMENVLRHAVLALLHIPNPTLPLIPRLLTDDAFRLTVVPRVTNLVTRRFFENRFAEWRDTFRAEAIEPLLTRLDTVLSFPVILNCLGQHKRTLRIDEAMQGRRVIIANLSGVGETAAHLMGALLLARVRTAALARARLRPQQRTDFHVVADEAQRYATHSLPGLLAEARKFSVSICYSTQMLDALTERTRSALLATTGTTVAFRVGPEDAAVMSRKFDGLHRSFNQAAFNELERGHAYVRSGAGDTRYVLSPPPAAGYGTAEIVRRQARRHYARPRSEAEGWLQKSMTTDIAGVAESVFGRQRKSR